MTDSAPPPPPAAKRRGCFFYGCIISLVLFFLIGIGAFFAVRYGVNRLNAVIVEYTDTNAMALPKVEMPADELQKLNGRIDIFDAALKAHTNTPPLILTGRDINALLATSPSTKGLKDHVYVALEGDQVKGEISLPLETFFRLPLLQTKGRYLNGQVSFKAAITNGSLWAVVQTMEVKGKPLPSQFMAVLQQQNIAADFNKSTNSAALKQYQSLEVTNGTVIITAKPD